MNVNIFDLPPPTIPANILSEFESWQEGFDACTNSEVVGFFDGLCPYRGKQARLWQQGYESSRRMTALGKELAAI